ncbi:MAG: serine--tRNA ligase [Azospirillaceae bacterium]
MHDIKWIRENPQAFDEALARRHLPAQSADILALDSRRREIQTELQSLQTRRNEVSRDIGRVKKEGGDADGLLAEVAGIKVRIPELEAEEGTLAEALSQHLAGLPNLPADDVPVGSDESDNVELRRVGEPRQSDTAREHFELGEALGLMDFAAAAKLSGSRFVVLKGALARLERALGQFMIDLHTAEHGYTEMQPPLLVRDDAAFGTGQLPKFAEDLFHTQTGHWLVPTAEVPLTNLVAGEILDAADLPLRLTALTPCFRAEAGAAGRDTRGMIRQHQFNKVELVSVTTPDHSAAEHERMLGCAEVVLQRLGLAYRIVTLSTGDLGFSAAKTWDIEVWLPGQRQYREISSCSNCADFQARRMSARFRPGEGDRRVEFVHTLNGSGVAVGRALIAVMETYQQDGGQIAVPDVLKPYMGGLESIGVAR